MTESFLGVMVAMLAVTVLGVRYCLIVFVLRFSAAYPDKDDHHQEHQQRTAEYNAKHAVKYRQIAKGAQTVPDRHKHKEESKQISRKSHLSADEEAEDRERCPEKHIKIG